MLNNMSTRFAELVRTVVVFIYGLSDSVKNFTKVRILNLVRECNRPTRGGLPICLLGGGVTPYHAL